MRMTRLPRVPVQGLSQNVHKCDVINWNLLWRARFWAKQLKLDTFKSENYAVILWVNISSAKTMLILRFVGQLYLDSRRIGIILQMVPADLF